MRHGDCVAVHSLRRGAAEALELVAHGDFKSSKVVGRRIEQINLPAGTTIGAIVRTRKQAAGAGKSPAERQVLIAHHDTMIQSDDHVIVFVINKRMVSKVEQLFQVNPGFL